MSEPAKVFEDRVKPGRWRVEWFNDDGRSELEIFTGPIARRQALRYHAEVRAFQGSAARTVHSLNASARCRANDGSLRSPGFLCEAARAVSRRDAARGRPVNDG